MQPLTQNKTAGFTLVEVITVVAIIGILSGLAISGMGRKVDFERTRGAAISLAAFMTRVSAEVKKQNADLSVRFSETMVDAFRSADCSGAILFSEVLETSVAIPNVASGAPAIAATNSWNHRACLSFSKLKIGENSVSANGWVRIDHRRRTNLRGLVLKSAADNRFRPMVSSDGGSTWTAP